MTAITDYHQPIADYFFKGAGKELQKLDSDIAEHVLLSLIEQGKAILPVHDSFVCRYPDLGLVLESMNEAAIKFIGDKLFVDIPPPKMERTSKDLTDKNSDYYKRRREYLRRWQRDMPIEPPLFA